jgi:hypothetical protein
VAGVETRPEALALMKDLEDRGYGRREERTAGNHAKVTWFMAGRDDAETVRDHSEPFG